MAATEIYMYIAQAGTAAAAAGVLRTYTCLAQMLCRNSCSGCRSTYIAQPQRSYNK